MNTEHSPLVSIILPVYNCEKYIALSIESILKQTFSNFELIIINDGSADRTQEVIDKFNDSRIVVVKQQNMGLAKSLNNGIKISKGKYIARQDADDISYPERLTKQINYLEKSPNIALIGAWARIINETGVDTGRKHLHATENCELKYKLYFDNPFVHSTIVFRKEIIEHVGVYDDSIHNLIQDFEYWFRISQKYDIGNISELLLDYREVNQGISKTTNKFSSVVAVQAAKNITSVLSNQHQPYGTILANIYHNVSGALREKKMVGKLLLCVEELCNKINGSNPCKISREKLMQFKLDIKYKYYNNYIYSETSSLITKNIYKIKRRFLIMRKSQ